MNYPQNLNANPEVNFESMSDDAIAKLRKSCDNELSKRHKAEVRKAKIEMKKMADKYGLSVTVETKK